MLTDKEIITESPTMRLAIVHPPKPQVVKMKSSFVAPRKAPARKSGMLMPPRSEFNTGFLKARKHDPL